MNAIDIATVSNQRLSGYTCIHNAVDAIGAANVTLWVWWRVLLLVIIMKLRVLSKWPESRILVLRKYGVDS